MSVQAQRALAQSAVEKTVARNRTTERIAFGVLGLLMLIVLSMVVWLLGYIVFYGVRTVNLAFLTQAPNYDSTGGIFPALVGTLYIMFGTILLALPLGIAGAIYLTEYAGRSRLVWAIRLAIVNLAGVPTIVHGLFGLGFFVYFIGGGIDRFILRRDPTAPPAWGHPCLLWGFCTLAVVILPIIITATEEALRAVPRSFREASMGLGASKWETIRRVVLPTAMPGILTGAILGIGRAAGETAPVMVTCAASFKPTLPQGLYDQAMLVPTHLYYTVMWVANSQFEIQAAIALVLVVLVFCITFTAILIRNRLRRARKW